MNNRQLQLVTFEQAKRLREKGFNWSVNHVGKYYDQIGDLKNGYIQAISAEYQPYPAPTVSLALKWFRDEIGIDNSVCLCAIHYEYSVDKVIKKTYYHNMIKDRVLPYRHDSYELAESALLDELLTLIENKK